MVFLVSDDAFFIIGAEIPVVSGLTTHAGAKPISEALRTDALHRRPSSLMQQAATAYAAVMTRHPDFGVLLQRLADHRKLDFSLLARRAEVEDSELRAVLRGTPPEPALLRRLASVLGYYAADLFVLAGAPVPEDLAPLDATAVPLVPQLVRSAVSLPPEGRRELIRFVRSLPQEDRTVPGRALQPYEQYQPSFGAVLLQMLANRNLYWTGAVQVMYELSGLYVSPSTIGGVGRGKVELTRDLLADFAVVLGIPLGPVWNSNHECGAMLRSQSIAPHRCSPAS
ncbi:hypothetical protein [Streptomyces sp. V4I2]|uniref:hypothetical protein n=1 Tax=Streptomyces sp. V4I2 TaxID=3042280 RepID=UPI002782C6FF|nr:transcriptional regulator with XRE-family HTH domain [Streptomyces sp. V4I2]